jgi:hypothetical protein
MSPRVQFVYYALWIAHPVLQSVLAGIMYRRKLHRKFPVFFAYVVSQVLIFAVLFPTYLRGPYFAFFCAYWITAAISLTLGFQVIYEVFLDVFRPYHTLKDLGAVLFKWASLVMLLVAAVVAAASTSSDQGPLVQAVLTAQRCVRVIQCGLALFLILFSHYLGVSRRQQSFGIAAGFGGFASVELVAAALRASGSLSEHTLGFIIMIGYNSAIFCWIGYMWAKSEAREPTASLLASQRWDESLMDLQHPMPADSLIPMFEGMVERAFTRSAENSSPRPDAPPETPSRTGPVLAPKGTQNLDDPATGSRVPSAKR